MGEAIKRGRESMALKGEVEGVALRGETECEESRKSGCGQQQSMLLRKRLVSLEA